MGENFGVIATGKDVHGALIKGVKEALEKEKEEKEKAKA